MKKKSSMMKKNNLHKVFKMNPKIFTNKEIKTKYKASNKKKNLE